MSIHLQVQAKLYNLAASPIARAAVAAFVMIFILPLAGCASANSTINTVGAETMNGVKTFSMFAAICLTIYWITYVVLFGLRNVWSEGYSQIQNTWRTAVFLTIGTVVGLPALLGWASEIVQSGGFEDK